MQYLAGTTPKNHENHRDGEEKSSSLVEGAVERCEGISDASEAGTNLFKNHNTHGPSNDTDTKITANGQSSVAPVRRSESSDHLVEQRLLMDTPTSHSSTSNQHTTITDFGPSRSLKVDQLTSNDDKMTSKEAAPDEERISGAVFEQAHDATQTSALEGSTDGRFTALEKGKWKAVAATEYIRGTQGTLHDENVVAVIQARLGGVILERSPSISHEDRHVVEGGTFDPNQKIEDTDSDGSATSFSDIVAPSRSEVASEEDESSSNSGDSEASSEGNDSESSPSEEEKRPCPKLPIEVWELVIDFVALMENLCGYYLKGPARDLRTCAKVCWSWRPRSLFHRRHRPYLGETSTMSFLDAIRHFPDVAFVEMEVVRPHDSEMALVPILLTRNCKYASSITLLRLNHVKILQSYHQNFLMMWRISFSNVTTLELRNARFSSVPLLIRFLLSFRSLTHLLLHHITCHKTTDAPLAVPISRRLRLRSLSCNPSSNKTLFLSVLFKHIDPDELELLALDSHWLGYLPFVHPSLRFLATSLDPDQLVQYHRYISEAASLQTLYFNCDDFKSMLDFIKSSPTLQIHTLNVHITDFDLDDQDKGHEKDAIKLLSNLSHPRLASLRHVALLLDAPTTLLDCMKREYVRERCRHLAGVLEERGGSFAWIDRKNRNFMAHVFPTFLHELRNSSRK